jgi:hypothetical protein
VRSVQALCVALLAVSVLIVASDSVVSAQEWADAATINGRVVHGGGDGTFDPTSLIVTLNVFEGVTTVEAKSIAPASDGTFELPVTASDMRTYFIDVVYSGARYSATLTQEDLADEVVIAVYEATTDIAVLQFTSYSIIVTGAVPSEGWIEVLERASVVNESGMTLVPDLAAEGPAMLSFLRFALPANAYNLDVRSSLVGGDIITVDRGFALTSPVVPTLNEPHMFEFVYRLNYSEPKLDLSRTMRFGAESIRYVVPADTGRPVAPLLEDLGATELNGRFLRLLEASDIQPGQEIELSIMDIPMPSFFDRAGASSAEWYVRYLAPVLIITSLILVTFTNIRRRQSLPSLGPSGDVGSTHAAILLRLVDVEARRESGSLSLRRYSAYRDQIKEALVDLHIRTQPGVNQADDSNRPD